MRVGGVVLCGGRSSRMGRPKLSLPFGDELLLPRVVRLLSEVVSPVVVVAAADQDIPPLPKNVELCRDNEEFLGPLAGLEIGLRALAGRADTAYASACDVPLLQTDFIRYMIQRLGSHEIAVPRDGEFHHPLAAVYRTSLVDRIRQLVAARRLRPLFLIQESDSLEISVDELRAVDPQLDSLRNVNHAEDYEEVLRIAGLPNASRPDDTAGLNMKLL